MTDQPSPPRATPAPARPREGARLPDHGGFWRGRIPWLALAPALIVLGGSIGAGHDDGHSLWLVGLLAGTAGLVMLIAFLRPRAAVLVNGVAVGAYFAFDLTNGPIFLTVPLVAFLASQRARPRPLLAALIPALAVIVAGLTARVGWHDASAAVSFWQGSGLTGLALAGAVLGWWLTDRRHGRREQAQRTAAEERLRMAQDLHDGVGHGLAVISMHAAVALHVLDKLAAAGDENGLEQGVLGGNRQLRQSLEVIRDTGRESLDALRVQLAVISTGSGASASRRPAPGLPELADLLARVRTGGLIVTRHGDPGEVPENVGQAVYAVVQESLTNVLRHARAVRAEVTLRRVGSELMVRIEDDGDGPGGAAADGTLTGQTSDGQTSGAELPGDGTGVAGMGLSGMRERVERLGGTFESGYRDGGFVDGGFVVQATLPIPEQS